MRPGGVSRRSEHWQYNSSDGTSIQRPSRNKKNHLDYGGLVGLLTVDRMSVVTLKPFPTATFTAQCFADAAKISPGCFAKAGADPSEWVDACTNLTMAVVLANAEKRASQDEPCYAAPPKLPFAYLDSVTHYAKTIDMSGHGIARLGNMQRRFDVALIVEDLSLAKNALTNVSNATPFADSLKTLSLAQNEIASLTQLVATNLKTLNLSANALPTLPPNASSLFPPRLEVLDLSYNTKLRTLNYVLFPSTLTTLYLDGNTIESLHLCNFGDLKTLSLVDAKIAQFTISIAQYNTLFQSVSVKTSSKTEISTSDCSTGSRQKLPSGLTVCVDGLSEGLSDTAYALIGVAVAVFVAGVSLFVYRRYRQSRKKGPAFSFSALANQTNRDMASARPLPMAHPMLDKNGDQQIGLGGRPRELTALATGADKGSDIRFDPQFQRFRIDHKEIVMHRTIASGGFGVVYLATYHSMDVAVKRMLPSAVEGNSDGVRDFMDEIRLCAQLDHPHIVRFIGVSWSTLKDLSAVLEFMPNGDLATLVRAKDDDSQRSSAALKLVWPAQTSVKTYSKVQVLSDVIAGLSYLHDLHVIHRDLKAKNVLLGAQFEAKLSDFGTSRQVVMDATMTAEIGTIAWIAPEILKGDRYSESADMYSFGVLVSEVDTGESPYGNAVSTNGTALPKPVIAMMVIEGELRPSFTDECPPEVLSIAQRCLDNDPLQRPSAVDVGRLLTMMLRSQTYAM
ncbi:TKL protein kinase [Saprolegnia diclina VS20]|uniref:TKL protein kinase n=1 Tax=Saprolegnia diclina (strain VS20) TaxID=1156394 RepID=T0RI86_SAPDV|nr:TKL protein kinase [Saprolegnia diclina VS20]EQC29512.1 TKL protein kinase [Saprolegnia diclina VS20]|eukprot:XP_008617064.1 TKL protein kinase [Saprolegnia diclina VS20]